MQERAGRAENGVRARPGDVAPHPAHHDQMREEYHGKPQTQRAGRPSKSAADSVESIESNQRTAPNGEARRDAGEALTDIARTFGVSHTTIGRLTAAPSA